jgi:beta-mannosidase
MQDIAKVAEPAEKVSTSAYVPKGWYKATVPGTVLTTLVNNGVYPEPLYGLNNHQIPEAVNQTSYWYRSTFTVPASFKGRHVWLDFEGTNYTAAMYVNGHEVGNIKGAFLQGMFDITPYAHVDSANVLAVKIDPQPHPGAPHYKTVAGGTGHNGGVTARDGATFLSSIGWDWVTTVRDRDAGIWRSVYLVPSGPVTVSNLYVRPDLPSTGFDYADLTVMADLHNLTEHTEKVNLVGAIGAVRFTLPVTLAPGEIRTVSASPSRGAPQLHVVHPKLWWPNGYGPQNLYHLNLQALVDGTVSDTQGTNFGVRRITYFVPGSDSLHLSVNGVSLMCVGGDWGLDEAMKRIPRTRLNAMIRFHQMANYNMIRNWVGQSTDEDFYDFCDRYGIMLWDEFFQPNPGDGPNPDDAPAYLANCEDKILRFRNHPSIAIWCGRNEGSPPPNIDGALNKLITSLDGQRYYQSSSTEGHGVVSHGPYFYQTPEAYFQVTQIFKTELGLPSIPTAEAIKAMMPKADWWPPKNDDWAEHDMTSGAQGGDRYFGMLDKRYGTVTGVDDFALKGQLVNYECYRAIYEGRNAHMFNPATAVLIWMSAPAQPSFVWQLFGHDLEPTAALYGARKGNEPVHVQLDQVTWHVEVVNHLAASLANASVTATVYNLDGTKALQQTIPVASAAPTALTDLGALNWPANLSDVHFVRLTLTGAAGNTISDNFYWRALPTHPDDFTALSNLAPATVSATATMRESGENRYVSVHLHNTSAVVALTVHLSLRNSVSGERILPAFADDDYVSLVPGQEKDILIEAARADTGADPGVVAISGYNVAKANIAIAPNATSPVTFTDLPEPPVDLSTVDTASFRTYEVAPPPPPRVGSARIVCGGPAVSPFAADQYGSGGNPHLATNDISVAGVANAAPAAAYRGEIYGAFNYTFPMAKLADGKTYTVRLHFSENSFKSAGSRKFNVDINDKRVLSDFDIFAEAGGEFKAVVKEFTGIVPDRNGNVVVNFTFGSADDPKVDAIEVIPG